jgi:hypothetical protein
MVQLQQPVDSCLDWWEVPPHLLLLLPWQQRLNLP